MRSAEYFCDPPDKGRKVGLNNSPDGLVLDRGIAVDQDIPERHNPAMLRNTARQSRVNLVQVVQRFTDDLKLPFYS